MTPSNSPTTTTPSSVKIEFCSHTQFGGFLARIIEHLCAEGYDASQLYLISEEDYRTIHFKLSRFWLRLRMFVGFPIMLALRLLFERGQVLLVVTSNPFFAPLVACIFGGRRTKVVHLLYDLYPDALIYSGKLRKNSLASRILDKMQRAILRRCDANVLLGEHLLAHVRERFGDLDLHNPVIIPVGADDEAFDAPLNAKSTESEPVRLLYCGNMGHMHDTATLSAALAKLCSSNHEQRLDFSFHASGAAYANFCSSMAATRPSCVKLEGYLNSEQWAKVMSTADIAIVTMKNGSERVVMPSKTYSAMQAAQAILAIAPVDSDLATLVQEHECGWVIAPGDVEALDALLQSLPARRAELHKKQKNSLNASNKHFSAHVVAKQWAALFQTTGLTS